MRSRWFTVLSIGLALNIGLVLFTSIWHIAIAQPPSAQEIPTVAPSADLQSVDDAPENLGVPAQEAELPESSEGTSINQKRDPEDNAVDLPIPELPEVPSLGDPDKLLDDAEFQGFQELANEIFPQGELMKASPESLGAEYFDQLDRRLKTVKRLTTSAQDISAEAAAVSKRGGSPAQVEQLLELATELRSIAAQLLSSP